MVCLKWQHIPNKCLIQTCHTYIHILIQHNDRFSEGGPLQMGSPVSGRPGVESPQQQQHSPMVAGAGPVPGVVGQSGFVRRSPVGGHFDGPNNKRHRY